MIWTVIVSTIGGTMMGISVAILAVMTVVPAAAAYYNYGTREERITLLVLAIGISLSILGIGWPK